MAKNPERVVNALVPVGDGGNPVVARVGEFTPGRLLILERLQHPLVQETAEDAQEDREPLSSEEVMQALFVLTEPIPRLKALLRSGHAAFEDAMFVYADTLPLEAMPALNQALNNAYERAMSTIVGGGDPGGSESDAGEPAPSASSPHDAPASTTGTAGT